MAYGIQNLENRIERLKTVFDASVNPDLVETTAVYSASLSLRTATDPEFRVLNSNFDDTTAARVKRALISSARFTVRKLEALAVKRNIWPF